MGFRLRRELRRDKLNGAGAAFFARATACQIREMITSAARRLRGRLSGLTIRGFLLEVCQFLPTLVGQPDATLPLLKPVPFSRIPPRK